MCDTRPDMKLIRLLALLLWSRWSPCTLMCLDIPIGFLFSDGIDLPRGETCLARYRRVINTFIICPAQEGFQAYIQLLHPVLMNRMQANLSDLESSYSCRYHLSFALGILISIETVLSKRKKNALFQGLQVFKVVSNKTVTVD